MIADPDPLARRAMRDALQDGAGFVVPAEASTGVEAVELARYYRPDLMLMEIDLPGIDGIAATRRIVAAAPEVRVLIASRQEGEEVQLEALRAGACGFISKGAPAQGLVRAARGVVRGEAAISRMIAMSLIERLRVIPEGGVGMRPVRSPLTSREWEVLDLITQGSDTRQIAEALVLSEATIYSHVKNLLRKLDVHSRREAIEAARSMRGPIAGLAHVPAPARASSGA